MIAGGVTLSVIVSPVVAAVTVGQSVLFPLVCVSLHIIQNVQLVSGLFVSLCLLDSTGIGVPIMLAYVYGVVPISLCRSGGCGVSAGNGKGVRIEFDDENDMNAGGGAAATGKLCCPSNSTVPHRHPKLTFVLKSARDSLYFAE